MKKINYLVAVMLLIILVIAVDIFAASLPEKEESTSLASGELVINSSLDDEVFPHDQVLDVLIEIDEDTYEEMLENATDETYVLADIIYNGYELNNVAIRPKGNSSLRDVAQSDSDRYSFKIDLDKYQEGQNLFGITKINLNNLFSDSTLMAEYIGYEMLDAIGAVASNTTYVSLTINDEYQGLYLAVEEVNESFLMDNYGNYDGELYKPDMGVGSDLSYISDDPEDYTGITTQNDDMETDEHWVQLVSTIDKIVENGGETEAYMLSDVLNVDSFLSYLAMSSVTVHMDTIQSGMDHNYYLYYNTDTGLFEWISWDLNMIFNGYPGSSLSDLEATEFLIDEPVIGEMTNYPLIEAVFTNEAYVETYHGYIQELIDGYLEEDTFMTTVVETYAMIESYASIDPTAFFSIDEVKESIFDLDIEATISLLEFVVLRVDHMIDQLDGTIASTNGGKGNSGTGSKMGDKGGMDMGTMDQDAMRPGGMRPGLESDVDSDQVGLGGEAERVRPADMEAGERPDMEMDERPEMPADGEMPEMPADGEMPEMPEGMEGGPPMMGAEEVTSSAQIGSQDDIINNIVPIGVSLLAMGGILVYLLVRKY